MPLPSCGDARSLERATLRYLELRPAASGSSVALSKWRASLRQAGEEGIARNRSI